MPGLLITNHENLRGDRFMAVVKNGEVIGYIKANLYDDAVDWFKAALRGINVLSIGTKLPKGKCF